MAAIDGRQSTLKRKSSMFIDLDREKDLSHRNSEDNWAAMTRASSLGHEGNPDSYRRLSQSRQSLQSPSRAVSMHSNGPDAALIAAMGWDGLLENQPMVEEPEETVALDRHSSKKSISSAFNSPAQGNANDGTRPPRSRQLSSRSSVLLPLPDSPDSSAIALQKPLEESIPSFAPNTIGRPGYDPMTSHMSISSVYAPYPKTRTFSSSSQQMPERPKSAMGLMAVNSPQDQSTYQRQHQWSPPTSPRNLPTMMLGRNQSRASVHGYTPKGSYSTPNWSPPQSPHRVASPNRPRPQLSVQYSSGEYPPSRYSHLDIVKQANESEAEGVVVPAAIAVQGGRQRSLSGGILLAAPAMAPELVKTSRTSLTPGNSASSSASNPASLSVRNASPEQLTEEEDEQDTENKKSSFWSPQAWLSK
jgi:hypothetical protein